MKYDPEIHQRRSIRLPGFDYAQAGAYYFTIVTHGREEHFGTVVRGEMKLNQTGQLVDHAWHDFQPIIRMSNWMRFASCRIMCMQSSY